MKLLAVSDIVVDWIYSPKIQINLADTDLVIGCGDLPQYYLEYLVSSLNVPVFNVYGNHSITQPRGDQNQLTTNGFVDLNCKVIRFKGYTFAGVEGSLRYNNGAFQYTQMEMWLNVFRLVPSILINRFTYGKYLNVLVTHAPAWGIHDQPDQAHQGIKAFRWLVTHFQPDYHLHGHVHVYRPDTVIDSNFGKTRVMNAYGYCKLEL